MTVIQKQYIVDETDRKVAVQIDVNTFEKIEEILEDYALVQLVEIDEDETPLSLEEANAYYQCLEKAS